MGRVGLEPTRCYHRQILSLMRLPIPPPARCQFSLTLLPALSRSEYRYSL